MLRRLDGVRVVSFSRSIRTRGGRVLVGTSLNPLAADGVRPTAPSAVALSAVTQALPHVAQLQTDPVVWSSSTIEEGWKQMHEALREAQGSGNHERLTELHDKDLKGLAWCTSDSEVKYLLDMLHPSLRQVITTAAKFSTATVEEFYLHLGQEVEVRGDTWLVRLRPPSVEELLFLLQKVGKIGRDGRGCVGATAHRVSVWRGRQGESLGVTVRVGRYVPNAAKALLPLVEKGNLLIIAKAGQGKTTLLRDLAASLANSTSFPRVAVVDTSNEIGGDGAFPMPFLGRCRRIQVPQREQQCLVMAEVIQNHSPEYLIVDELVSEAEAQAGWSISQRGVRLIATCHGETLEGLLQNQSLKLLVGGTAQAFLSNEERRLRNKEKKTVLERPYSSPFRFVVEITKRNEAFVYVDVNKAVDLVLDDKVPRHDSSVGEHVNLLHDLPARLKNLIERHDRSAEEKTFPQKEELKTSKENAKNDSKPRKKGSSYLKSERDLLTALEGFI